MSRLSVIVACHNAGDHLHRCLDSILASPADPGEAVGVAGTVESVEVVAVDDASTDRTAEILDSYAAADARVRVVRLTTNVGPGPARNVGLARAQGDYVWFVDADDWLPPGSVTAVHERLRVHEPDILLVDHAEVFGPETIRRRTLSVLDTDAVDAPIRLADHPRLLNLAQSACTKVIRRTLLTRTGIQFPPGRYEDALFSPVVLMAAGDVDVLDRVCYHYRQSATTSFTATPSATHLDVFSQYARLFAHVDAAAGELDAYRARLFRVMIDHYLVVLGHRSRLPRNQRRQFFTQMAADYVHWRPPAGYPLPRGQLAVKHALVRWGWYPSYAVMRWAFRLLPRRSPTARGR